MAGEPINSSSSYLFRLQKLNLLENPYLVYEDGRYFNMLTDQRQAYQDLLQAVAEKPLRNINLIIGDWGMGKTQLARRIAGAIQAAPLYNAWSVYIDSSQEPLTPARMVKIMATTVGVDVSKNEQRLEALRRTLQASMETSGRSLFVVINGDLNTLALGTLREISNWFIERQTSANQTERHSLVQFALFGTNASVFFREIQNPFSPLHPLVGKMRTLGTPAVKELGDLIKWMARTAGYRGNLFNEEAIDLMIQRSNRIPGVLIYLARQALELLIQTGESTVTEQMVRDILPDQFMLLFRANEVISRQT